MTIVLNPTGVPSVEIDEDDIEVRFIRSGGPGGQHVNKVSTGVQLRFDLGRNRTLPPAVKARARRLAGQRLTGADEILIEATRHRSQDMNRQDALERLGELLGRAAIRPKPRKKTRPSRASVAKRLDGKRQRGAVKRLRRSPPTD